MRILLDECLPKRLKRDLTGHDAKSVPEMGWAGQTNGALLTLAQVDFEVFLTVDRNLSVQQDVNRFNIAVVVLVATSNKHSMLPLQGRLLAGCSVQGAGKTSQRVVVTFFYLGFVGVSLDALWKTYQSLDAVVVRLQQLMAPDDLVVRALVAHLGNSDRLVGMALHLLGDALVVFCIWRFTVKASDPVGSSLA